MKHVWLAAVGLCLVAGSAQATVIQTRGALDALLGSNATTETFHNIYDQAYAGLADPGDDVNQGFGGSLNSTTIIPAQYYNNGAGSLEYPAEGPGLVAPGITFSSPHSNGGPEVDWLPGGVNAEESSLNGNGPILYMSFSVPVTAVGFDLPGWGYLKGYDEPISETVIVFDTNGNVLYTSPVIMVANEANSGEPEPIPFFGISENVDIGEIELSSTNMFPLVADISFGVADPVPEPPTLPLVIGALAIFFVMRQRSKLGRRRI